jgi:hypothetical protein
MDWLQSFLRWFLRWIRRLWCLITCWFAKKPTYEPDRWNDPYQPGYDYGHQADNNCYNYACDRATDTFAQPGYAGTGVLNWVMQCPEVSAGAQADGLHSRPDGTPASERCCHTVALVVAPGIDYHWYRLDDNGMWSHKPGQTAARNVDNSNQPIANPETADRGPYTQFCGYFTVCRCQVTIDGRH